MALFEMYKPELKISNRIKERASDIFNIIAWKYKHRVIPKEKMVIFEICYEDGSSLQIDLHHNYFHYLYFKANYTPIGGVGCQYDLERIQSIIERKTLGGI